MRGIKRPTYTDDVYNNKRLKIEDKYYVHYICNWKNDICFLEIVIDFKSKAIIEIKSYYGVYRLYCENYGWIFATKYHTNLIHEYIKQLCEYIKVPSENLEDISTELYGMLFDIISS